MSWDLDKREPDGLASSKPIVKKYICADLYVTTCRTCCMSAHFTARQGTMGLGTNTRRPFIRCRHDGLCGRLVHSSVCCCQGTYQGAVAAEAKMRL